LEARLAEYWISYCYTQADRIKESIALLQSVAEFCQKRNYKWLLAQTDNWLATDHAILSEHSDAIKYDQQSLALAEAISDTYQMQKVLSELGNEYTYLRQTQLSLEYHYRSLILASQSAGSPRQSWRNFSYTATALFAFKYYEAAATFASEALHLEIDDQSLTYILHLRLGQIYSKLRRFDEAMDQANLGLQMAQSVQDETTRQKYTAASFMTQANILRENYDYEQAILQYNKATELYERMEFNFYSYATYKGRLICLLALNDEEGIQHDLPLLLQLAERYRARIHEEQYRNSFFDDEQSIYDIAVEYEHQKGDDVRAFNYAEASHGRSLLDALAEGAHIETTAVGPDMVTSQVTSPSGLEDLRKQLPEKVRVIMYTVLPTKLLIWDISREGFDVHEKEITAESLKGDVQSYIESLKEGRSESYQASLELGAKLYETLLDPVAKKLRAGQSLCFIPDKFLNYLSFAALVSPESERYLIEDWPIFYAPSLNVMSSCSQNAQRKAQKDQGTILSVGNPTFDRRAYPDLQMLEAAKREASGVAGFFSRPTRLLGTEATKGNILRAIQSAEIIHFAGHYVIDDSNPLLSKMLLAAQDTPGSDGQDSTLAASEILEHRFDRTKLIVLSACQTGLDKYYNGEGAVGLSRSFIEAKIPLVVASQWPVDSNGTADLMISFYKHRRSGLPTVYALRQAQVEMLHGPDKTYQSPYYWAAFLCVGGYAEY
jgi:CHAT domain-containing protein